MFIVLKQAGYFARTHAQPLLFIALLLSLPGWILEYAFPDPVASAEVNTDISSLGASLVLTLVAVIQFAAAMIYIHQQVLRHPISALQAIALGISRLGALLLINALMALAIGLGLALLIAPGLYMAYKLLFAEFYLLFHGQRPLQALRSSFRDNSGLADKLLPPLLFWGGLLATTAIGQQLLLQQGADPLLINLLFEAILIVLTLWGWALMYRLYQLHIEPQLPSSAVAVSEPEPELQPELQPEQQPEPAPKTLSDPAPDQRLPADDAEPLPPPSPSSSPSAPKPSPKED